MRLVSSATWTSGEPVSVSCVRNCLTMSAFPDSYSVTFTLPPNDSNYSLFLISREDYHRRGWACQLGLSSGRRPLTPAGSRFPRSVRRHGVLSPRLPQHDP